MRKIIRIFISFLFVFNVCSFASVDRTHFNIQTETLENGLKIIVVPLKSNNVVRFGIVYNVGSADDPISVVGISHFLEHMMFKGTKTISGKRLKYILDKYNSDKNAGTGYDLTYYYYTVNKNFLHIDLKIEADRMKNLSIDEEEMEKERSVVLEERYMVFEMNPQRRYVTEMISKVLYLYSNYSYPIIGYKHQIESYTKSALKTHYEKYYVPNNATIVIVGDITKEEAIKLVKESFGSFKKGKDVERKRVLDPKDAFMTHTITRTSDQINAKTMNIIYSFDRENISSLKKYYIAEIITDMFCGTQRSYVYKELVEKKGVIPDILGGIDCKAYDKSFLVMSAELYENNSFQDAEKSVYESIESFKNDILKKNELVFDMFTKTKERMLGSIKLATDNPSSVFSYIIKSIEQKYNLEDVKNLYKIIDSITFEDIQNALKYLFVNKALLVYTSAKGK